MPRDAKVQFTTKKYNNDMVIALPSFFSMLKVMIFAIIIYPWYYIVSRKKFLNVIFEYLFYNRPISMSGSEGSDSSSPPPKPFLIKLN